MESQTYGTLPKQQIQRIVNHTGHEREFDEKVFELLLKEIMPLMEKEILSKDKEEIKDDVVQDVKTDGVEDFVLPLELRRKVMDILNDRPTLKKVGDKEYKVYNLRAYSYNRILKAGLRLIENDKSIDSDNKLMYAVCTDLEASSKIVAIILCNHLFKADDIEDFKSATDAMTRNDKMIETMKARVLNSVLEPNQWAAIILGAMESIDMTSLFIMLTLAKRAMDYSRRVS